MNWTFKKAAGAVLGVLLLIMLIWSAGYKYIEGKEVAVLQHLTQGVLEDQVWTSGTKVYFGIMITPYVYDIGTQKCTFADPAYAKDSTGVEYNRIELNCGEGGGQSAWVSMSINYRIGHEANEKGEPEFSMKKLIALHKDGIGDDYEDIVIKRTVIDVVNELARPRTALEIYSGQGFVTFKEDVERALKNHPVFTKRGIYVENAIVYQVSLNPAYEAEIELKQLAIQQKLKEVEATKASEQKAKRIFADSQALVSQRSQAAEAGKIERVKAAEASAREVELAADAEKKRNVLVAIGEKEADMERAIGELAVGKARAEVEQLLKAAKYDGEAGERRASVEIANLRAQQLKGMLSGARVLTDQTLQIVTDEANRGIGVNVQAQ